MSLFVQGTLQHRLVMRSRAETTCYLLVNVDLALSLFLINGNYFYVLILENWTMV